METLSVITSAFIVYFPNFVGFLLPPFVEILNKDVKSDWERYIVSLITCLLIGILLHWNDIAHGTPQDTFLYATMIFVESNTIYKLYFANSRLRGFINNEVIPRLPSASPSPSRGVEEGTGQQ